jgi:predicted nucleotide-binding protein
VQGFLNDVADRLYDTTQRAVEKYLDADEMASVQIWIRITRTYIDIAHSSEGNYPKDKTNSGALSSLQEIFIVHGHDDLTKLEVARFIETELR